MTALLRKLALQDKVALITGGGRGIGAACAKLFAQNGAKVVITSRTQGDLDKVVDQITDTGKVFAIPTDIGDEKCVLELFKQVERRFGPVDIMVNNAAVIARGEVTEFEVSEWDELMRVNLRGSFLCAREAFRQMKASRRGGSIVNVSSLGGIRGTEKFKGFSAYTVSKHGIVGLTSKSRA
ncbi:MAG: SDR family NAD(P)-dependent oxidoreductase [bacterium]